MPNEETLTVSQAADEAQVSRQYIHEEIDKGNIEARPLDPTKRGSPFLVKVRSFRAWLKKRRQKTTRPA